MKKKTKNTAAKSPKKGFWARFFRFLKKFILLFFIISISWVVLARFVPVFVTPLMAIRSIESVFEGKNTELEANGL